MKTRKKTKNKREQREKLIHIALFAVSALFLFSPLLFAFKLGEFKSFGLLGIGILNFLSSATLFFPAPGIVATGIGGAHFNPLLVALFSASGSAMGESVAFAFGYSSTKLTNSEKHILSIFTKLFHHKHTTLLIFLFAFVPNPFFDVMGILAGVSHYSLRRFLFIVFAARFMRDTIVAFIGSQV